MSATIPTPTCALNLNPDDLSAWRDHALSAADERRITAHVADCPACQGTIATHSALAADLSAEPSPMLPPQVWRALQASIAAGHTAPRISPRWPRAAVWSGVGAVVAVAVIASLFVGVFGQLSVGRKTTAAATATANQAIALRPRNTQLPIVQYGYLQDLSFSSPQDGWAVGGIEEFTPEASQGVLVHYHDGVWEPATDTFPNLDIRSVSMLSASDGWATAQVQPGAATPGVAVDYYTGTVLLHFTGDSAGVGHWRTVNAPTLLQGLTPGALHMFSPDSGYMLTSFIVPRSGNQGVDSGVDSYPAAAVEQHGAWTLVHLPTDFYAGGAGANSLTMVSPTEGWANVTINVSGADGSLQWQTKLYHYVDGAWTMALTFAGLVESLSASASDDVWLMASQCPNCGTAQPVIERYNGATWMTIPGPNPDDISMPIGAPCGYAVTQESFIATTSSGGWVSATWTGLCAPQTVTWRYTDTGWQVVAPTITGMVTGITDDGQGGAWALDNSFDSAPTKTTILYTHSGTWSVYGQS